jgi:hypothetical protein
MSYRANGFCNDRCNSQVLPVFLLVLNCLLASCNTLKSNDKSLAERMTSDLPLYRSIETRWESLSRQLIHGGYEEEILLCIKWVD